MTKQWRKESNVTDDDVTWYVVTTLTGHEIAVAECQFEQHADQIIAEHNALALAKEALTRIKGMWSIGPAYEAMQALDRMAALEGAPDAAATGQSEPAPGEDGTGRDVAVSDCSHRHLRTEWLNDPSWPEFIEAICLDCDESMSYAKSPVPARSNALPPGNFQKVQGIADPDRPTP